MLNEMDEVLAMIEEKIHLIKKGLITIVRKFLKEEAKAKGTVLFEAIDPKTGEVLRTIATHNMIVNAGLNFTCQAISRTTTPIGYLAAGTGSTAVAAGQTTLATEIDRVALLGYDDVSPGAIVFRGIFEANEANGNLIEFGLFNDATAGTMFCRTVLGLAFTKDTSISLRVTWTITYTDT